jgi:branched-chain amino acid transport system permease protein
METFLQTLLDGLAVGSLYALIALGYTMVYGILKFINFSHSDVFVLGAWLTYTGAVIAMDKLHLWKADEPPPWYAGVLILMFAMFACSVVAFAIERLAYKPLRNVPRLNVLITAIGVSLFLQNIGQLDFVFGTKPQRVPTMVAQTDPLAVVGGVKIWLVDVLGAGTAILLMVALDRLVFHSKLGRAMRAVSHNHNTAALMGINVDRIISITFIIGAALAAAAGFLVSQKYPGINQTAAPAWVLLGLKAFVAAVIGGIGNIRGAMAGGILIGLLEFFVKIYVPNGTALVDVCVFGLLILILLVKPAGIFGKASIEKV